jgi:hypothetical protein
MVINMPLYAKTAASQFSSATPSSSPIVIDPDTPELLSKLQKDSTALNMSVQPLGQIMAWVALQLINQPYVGSLLDLQQPEYLYISLTKTDCMLFIEEVLAVSRLIQQHKLTMPNFIAYVKQLRYHQDGSHQDGSHLNGNHLENSHKDSDISYCTRNNYFKDWALTNIQKGIVVDEALPLTNIVFPYKAEVMSAQLRHNPKLLHYADLACIVKREQYINTTTQKLGFISLKLLPKYLGKIQNGDIVGIVRFPTSGDAVHHLGIAYIDKNGVVGMIHASNQKAIRRVVIAPSLIDYLAKFNDAQGIILLRG